MRKMHHKRRGRFSDGAGSRTYRRKPHGRLRPMSVHVQHCGLGLSRLAKNSTFKFFRRTTRSRKIDIVRTTWGKPVMPFARVA